MVQYPFRAWLAQRTSLPSAVRAVGSGYLALHRWARKEGFYDPSDARS